MIIYYNNKFRILKEYREVKKKIYIGKNHKF
jgi:hypothetical protein